MVNSPRMNLIIDHIRDLNSRHIQKRQASGFTLWAVLALMSFLLFNIIDKMYIVLVVLDARFILLILITMLLNFYFILAQLILTFLVYGTGLGKRKIVPNIGKRSSVLLGIGITLVSVGLCILNFILANVLSLRGYAKWPYIAFGIITLLNGLGVLFLFWRRLYLGKIARKEGIHFSETQPLHLDESTKSASEIAQLTGIAIYVIFLYVL
jgi:hypothetical protein